MKKKALVIFFCLITIFCISCGNKKNNYKLIFSEEKSKNNYALVYQFANGNKLYSEFSNVEFEYIEGKKYDLSTALKDNLITMDEIISKMKLQDELNDGGSKIYIQDSKNKLSNSEFIIVKCNTLDNNHDIIIGSNQYIIEKCSKDN